MASKNRCAFPECYKLLIDFKTKTITGVRCHIKGEKRGSARHDRFQSQKDRDSYENLIMMCREHHTIIDENPEIYTVEVLTEMKRKHEESLDVSPAFFTDELGTIKQGLANIEGLIRKRNEDEG